MFQRLTPDLCEPPVRAFMEKQCAQIADGQASQESVVKDNIKLFHDKFRNFHSQLDQVKHILAPKGDDWNDGGWGSGGYGGKSWQSNDSWSRGGGNKGSKGGG